MINERLNKLRERMAEEGIDVYYFSTSDYHMSEYVADYFRTILYFSNFSGSLATLLVDREEAYLFVDGRYHIQADKQSGTYGIKIVKLGTEGALNPLDFIKEHYKDKVLGLDGKRTSIAFGKALEKMKVRYVSLDIYSSLIEGRSPLSDSKLFELSEKYTGESRRERLEDVAKHYGNDVHVINNLESVAYLLNLRGDDIPCTPVFMAYLVLYRGSFLLFINRERLSDEIRRSLLSDGVAVNDYDDYYRFLETLKNENVFMDENKVNLETFIKLKDDNHISFERSYVELKKASKNDVEIQNARMAHIYDGVAMVKFLYWLNKRDKREISEWDAAEYLNKCRLNYKAFDLSFTPIVAYNANAAMMHYAPTENKCARLGNEGILLVDSGGQYYEGTTDITRTIALGPVSDEIKKHFTLVLKSMFNLSSVKFLSGLSGNQLDILARKDLWAEGIDYRCGTGHGVGHVLAVHEGPPNIRPSRNPGGTENEPLRKGNIFSDEPGVYLEGKYGIRCENLLLCREDEKNEYGQFLSFETLTMCPFDRKLIDKRYLDAKTVKLLNDYHKTVYENLSPYLNDTGKAFLKGLCEEI